MIDYESEIFSKIATAVHTEFSSAFITPEYVSQPPVFPAISVVEMDNTIYLPGRDSGDIENFAELMYQVDIYSNKNQGKKAECRQIAALIDAQFASLGFTRTFLNPVQNLNDPTIYRMTGRYTAIAGKDQYIYRR